MPTISAAAFLAFASVTQNLPSGSPALSSRESNCVDRVLEVDVDLGLRGVQQGPQSRTRLRYHAAKRAVGGVEPEGEVVQATACTYNAQCGAQGRGRRRSQSGPGTHLLAADHSVRLWVRARLSGPQQLRSRLLGPMFTRCSAQCEPMEC